MIESALADTRTDCVPSSWCNSVWKRWFDLVFSSLLLIICSPVMLVVALAVKLSSPGPVFFRQRRPGKKGQEFSILKFRTMVVTHHHAGPVLTRAMDPRITWLGRHIRQWKLDELPQLFNVVRGEMSFVGPRPQPTKLWREPSISEDACVVLSVRPGITSQATLVFRNEEAVLAPLSCDEIEEVYVRTLMPLKLKIEIQYLQKATFLSDLKIAVRTVGRVFNHRKTEDNLLKEFLPSANGRHVKSNSLHAKSADESWVPSSLPHWPLLSKAEDANTIATRAASSEEGGSA